MQSLNNTKTKQNLIAALAGESQARVKYDFYSSQAKKDGYIKIKNIFEETSNNEREHAKIWFKILNDGIVPSTTENLLDAQIGEHYEYSDMYKTFAEDAFEEGFEDIGNKFLAVAEIEKLHAERFEQLLDDIENDNIFVSDKVVTWKCLNCGHEEEGFEAPELCSVCEHAQAYFIKI